MKNIHETRTETQGFSIVRRDDGVFTLHTWHKHSDGVVRSLPQVHMTEQQMLTLFDDIGRELIGVMSDELTAILSQM